MPASPRPDPGNPFHLLAGVFVLAVVTHALKLAARGERVTRVTIWRQVAEALLTGLVAAGVWSGVNEIRELRGTTGIAIAVFVAMLGVRYVVGLIDLAVKKKMGAPEDDDEGPRPGGTS